MKFVANPAIEPLESRIAPARVILVGGPNGQFNDVNYEEPEPGNADQEAIFVNTEDAINEGDTGIAGKVGPGLPGVDDTYYVRLSKGDVVQMYDTSSNFQDYLTVKSGNIIAFFVDANGNNEVDRGELTGISMGKGASFILRDDIQGDVVSNLNEHGTPSLADDELDMSGLISSKQSIKGIDLRNGQIGGSIIAGGNIDFINVEGTVSSILTGSAAHNKSFDFFRPVVYGPNPADQYDAPGGTGTILFTAEPGNAGGNIKNVFVQGLGNLGGVGDAFDGMLKAGNGGAGAAGGSITSVQITSDANGIWIQGGDGGAGVTGKAGAGGGVSKVYISGVPDLILAPESVTIKGGNGGTSEVLNAKTGGAGGSLKDIFVGYRLFGSKPFATDDLLTDSVRLEAGAGGYGKIGGAGGSVTNADIRVDTAYNDGQEIVVLGGAGGASNVAGGKGGAGGNLLTITARNQDIPGGVDHAATLFEAGAGGLAGAASSGGKGGNITNGTMLGWELRARGGNGGDGKIGGAGGAVTNIVVEKGEGILANGGIFTGGLGGSGAQGNGGAGGNIDRIAVAESDLSSFIVKAGDAGNGVGGKGGAGGSVQRIDIVDGDFSNGTVQTGAVPLTIESGAGGDGSKGGGLGGSVKTVSVESKNANVALLSGSGGDVLNGGVGKGGAGGSFENVSVFATQAVGPDLASARVESGAGGSGAGKGGSGGIGGNVRTTTLKVDGSGHIEAGKGGNGQLTSGSIQGGAAGQGGSVFVSQVTAGNGDGTLIAGDAGADGAKAGAGGSISGQNADLRSGVFANHAIVIRAGNGTHGGAGGNVRFVGYGSSNDEFSPSPFGNIEVSAGNGSAEGKVAGAGGSVIDLSGSLASEDPAQIGVVFTTSIHAGNGGGGINALKSGAGGSIKDVLINGGGYDGAVLRFQAGDAGNAPGASTGAKGGDVQGIVVSNVVDGTIVRSVVAGNGGNASVKGGLGGNIDSIYVGDLDIGSRADVPFGVDEMGGLFAGAGGTAGTTRGLNGKVSTVVAKGIGSIVAGRELVPLEVESVSNIVLSGSDTLLQANNVFVKPGPFRLAFTADGKVTETTAGDGATNEVQTIFLGQLLSANTSLIFSFGVGDDLAETSPLAGSSTAAQIDTALEALPSIVALNGTPGNEVDVVAVAGGFTVTFTSTGNQTSLAVTGRSETGVLPADATANDVELALNNLPSIQYLGDTLPVPIDGTVDVTGKNGSFKVTFQQTGNVLPLDGVEIFSSNLTELTQGFVEEVAATTPIPGTSNIDVFELQPGEVPVGITEFRPGTDAEPEGQGFDLEPVLGLVNGQMRFSFTSSGAFVEATAGNISTKEIQTLDLAGIKADPGSTFTISYNNVTSVPLAANATQAQIQTAINAMSSFFGSNAATVQPIVGTLLTIQFNNNGARNDVSANVSSTSALMPTTANYVQIETELNKMGSVKFTNLTNRTTGSVDVREPDALTPTAYFLDFSDFGDQQLMSLNAFTQETQEINRDDIDPAGEFTLSFSRNYAFAETTKGSTIAKEIQAINLGPINNDLKTTLVFSINGRSTVAALNGASTGPQIQAALSALGLGTFVVSKNVAGQITFQFPTTGDNANLFTMTAKSETASLVGTSDNVAIQNALNGLATVKGPLAPGTTETVTVTNQLDGDFEVRFNTNGQRNPIVAGLSAFEVQELDVRSLLNEATGSFRLSYGGDYTTEILPNADPSVIQQELDGLQALDDVGGVTVTAGSAPGLYLVQFVNKGDKVPLTIRFEIDEVQDVDYTPGKELTLGVSLDYVAIESVPGNPSANEVQSLELGTIILGSSDVRYTISFLNSVTNEVETTVPLAGDATQAEIQQAIDDLNVFVPGDVTVDRDAGAISFTFNTPGDQPTLLTAHATQTAVLPANPTKSQLETALNDMATVQATAFDDTPGEVVVTPGVGSNFTVRFISAGDVPMITATQEEALLVSEVRPGIANALTEIQAFSPTLKGQPFDAAYAVANLIGFYADHSEVDANVFHFLRGNVLMTGTFLPGDQPVDGLVFAKKMTGVSVTPEAYRVGGDFYDWNNII